MNFSAPRPYAWLLARRAAGAMVASACVCVAVVLATDEATNTVGMRVARVAALGPLIACLGVFAVFAHAQSRGELKALEALGSAPWDAARGAAAVGWGFGALALLLLVSPWADTESLFPRLPLPLEWSMDAARDAARSAVATVHADGSIALAARATRDYGATYSAVDALACLGPIVVLAPAWAVTPMPARYRAGSLLSTAMLLIVWLHLVAARRLNAVGAPFASLPLCAALIAGRGEHRRFLG